MLLRRTQLVALLGAHRAEQERERAIARRFCRDEGWVFASPTGDPVKPHTDYREWKRLLKEAGLRETRQHDARHTAATVLLILGVPSRTVMSLMGWSSAEMAARYQHITHTIRQDVARQVDTLIWRVRGGADAADPDALDEPDGAADRTVVPVDRLSLAAILSLAEIGLAHADQTTIACTRAVVEDIRALLTEGADEPRLDSDRTDEREAN